MSTTNVRNELAELEKMTAPELRVRYRALFGDEARSHNRQWLLRRCAWRVQALAEGNMTERLASIRARGLELANDADVRFIPPRQAVPNADKPRQVVATDFKPDQRLPVAGGQLTRVFKGRLHCVTVLPNGFEYEGTLYQSLSAVAFAISGSHWNGYHFFKEALIHAKKTQEVG